MERRFRSGQQCILYHTDFVAKVVIADQVCGVCDTKRSYDGMTDGVINVDNHYLFTHELIVEYLDGYFFSGTPLASFFASKLSLWKRKSWGWSGESEHIAHVDCAYLEKNCDFQKFKVWIAILIPWVIQKYCFLDLTIRQFGKAVFEFLGLCSFHAHYADNLDPTPVLERRIESIIARDDATETKPTATTEDTIEYGDDFKDFFQTENDLFACTCGNIPGCVDEIVLDGTYLSCTASQLNVYTYPWAPPTTGGRKKSGTAHADRQFFGHLRPDVRKAAYAYAHESGLTQSDLERFQHKLKEDQHCRGLYDLFQYVGWSDNKQKGMLSTILLFFLTHLCNVV
jgi:hypothetical protein